MWTAQAGAAAPPTGRAGPGGRRGCQTTRGSGCGGWVGPPRGTGCEAWPPPLTPARHPPHPPVTAHNRRLPPAVALCTRRASTAGRGGAISERQSGEQGLDVTARAPAGGVWAASATARLAHGRGECKVGGPRQRAKCGHHAFKAGHGEGGGLSTSDRVFYCEESAYGCQQVGLVRESATVKSDTPQTQFFEK